MGEKGTLWSKCSENMTIEIKLRLFFYLSSPLSLPLSLLSLPHICPTIHFSTIVTHSFNRLASRVEPVRLFLLHGWMRHIAADSTLPGLFN